MKQFYYTLKSPTEINTRTNFSYTFDSLMFKINESIAYMHSNVEGVNNKKVSFTDTLEIPNHEIYDLESSSLVFSALYNTLSANAIKVNSVATPHYLGFVVKEIGGNQNNKTIEMRSFFSNHELQEFTGNQLESRTGPGLPAPVYMPENRYYGTYGDCDWNFEEHIRGAADYAAEWLVNTYPYQSLSPGQYLSPNLIIEDMFDMEKNSDEWDNPNYVNSVFLRDKLHQNNASDIIKDGHLDSKTYFFRWDFTGTYEDRKWGTCVTPSELVYYCNNFYYILRETMAHYNNHNVLIWLSVEDAYNVIEPNELMFYTWGVYINTSKVLTPLEPAPGKPFDTE